MTTWGELTQSQPEFAGRVRSAFEAGKQKILATLRTDGSPRVSGIESYFIGPELWFGSMPGAVKGRDLLRDPRFALHGPPLLLLDPPRAPGDAKLSGLATHVTDRRPGGPVRRLGSGVS
jgi:hypothetical protein